MSFVTNVVVHCHMADDEFLVQVNRWLASKGPFSLQDFPVTASGGSKCLEMYVLAGGMNYFGRTEQEFIDYIISYPWIKPNHVVVIIREEDGPPQVYCNSDLHQRFFIK